MSRTIGAKSFTPWTWRRACGFYDKANGSKDVKIDNRKAWITNPARDPGRSFAPSATTVFFDRNGIGTPSPII